MKKGEQGEDKLEKVDKRNMKKKRSTGRRWRREEKVDKSMLKSSHFDLIELINR